MTEIDRWCGPDHRHLSSLRHRGPFEGRSFQLPSSLQERANAVLRPNRFCPGRHRSVACLLPAHVSQLPFAVELKKHATWHRGAAALQLPAQHRSAACRPIHRFVLFSGFTKGRKHLASRRARCSAAAARAAWLRGLSSGTTRSSFCGGRRLRMGEWICSTRAYDKVCECRSKDVHPQATTGGNAFCSSPAAIVEQSQARGLPHMVRSYNALALNPAQLCCCQGFSTALVGS